jgi:hypothetical protein
MSCCTTISAFNQYDVSEVPAVPHSFLELLFFVANQILDRYRELICLQKPDGRRVPLLGKFRN